MRKRTLHPSTPLVSGLIAALAFMAGAAAFEFGRSTAEAETRAVDFPAESIAMVAPSVEAPIAVVEEVQPDLRPVVALVIDDAGIDPQLTRRTMALNVPLTLSFLPYAEATPDLARAAAANGHAVFLHMPMEPFGLEDPGPGALTRYLPPDEMARRVNAALERVPGAIGLNNHMGSAFTAEAAAMRAALTPLAGRDLIFLDSLTSGRSRAGRIADELGLISYRRDIFIDHDADAVTASLDALVAAAHRNGQAIAIGHPRTGTLEALESWLQGEAAQSVRFVTMSEYAEAIRESAELAERSDEAVGLFGGAE
ncbi:divergent polysaccharide deacetylase family protein [Hyphobacterium sp.]|uniref:divergent polysaccharide deacetylase family protein n=1 Tax=Hyphobacterium sp. TaxID=2004662 RepID=UPI00374A400D